MTPTITAVFEEWKKICHRSITSEFSLKQTYDGVWQCSLQYSEDLNEYLANYVGSCLNAETPGEAISTALADLKIV